MEIPVMCRLNDLETSLSCLNNPTLLSRIFSFSGVEMVAHAQSLWKWGALVLALVAALSGLANRVIGVLICRLHSCRSLSPSQTLLGNDDDDYFSVDDDSCTSATESSSDDDSDEDDDDDDDETHEGSLHHRRQRFSDEDFVVAGSSSGKNEGCNGNMTLRRRCGGGNAGERFSWSDFANGKSVVNLWDGLGLGFDVDKYSSGSLISLWDLNRDLSSSGSILNGKSQIPGTSSALIVAAAADEAKNLALSVWDRRISGRSPAIYAEWKPQSKKTVAARVDSGGVGKVYVGDDISGDLTVGDLRNAVAPLGKVAESREGDTWWDAGAVVAPNLDEFVGSCCDSVVSRCRDAVRLYLF